MQTITLNTWPKTLKRVREEQVEIEVATLSKKSASGYLDSGTELGVFDVDDNFAGIGDVISSEARKAMDILRASTVAPGLLPELGTCHSYENQLLTGFGYTEGHITEYKELLEDEEKDDDVESSSLRLRALERLRTTINGWKAKYPRNEKSDSKREMLKTEEEKEDEDLKSDD